jgi:hypothetical protein
VQSTAEDISVSVRAVAYMKALTQCPNGERITGPEKFLGMILGDSHQDRAHARTFPSIETIAHDAIMSESTCFRVLASLERKGVIRREHPNGTGRGKLTFYFFPELDEKGCQSDTLPAVEKDRKGCQPDTLFSEEGCQKGVRRVSKRPPHILSNGNKNNEANTPPTPASGGDVVPEEKPPAKQTVSDRYVELAVDQVMHGCGFVRRRLRRVLRAAIEHRRDLGESTPTIALAMIAAWKYQSQQHALGLLRVKFGPEKFFGDANWHDCETWFWDREAVERKKNASVGVWRP